MMLHSFRVDELTADGSGSSTPAVSPPQPAADQTDGPGSSTGFVPTHIHGTPLLSRMNDVSVHTNLNHSLRDLMPTPRIAKSNRARARKSINYTANVVSKQLFDNYCSELQMNRKAKKSHDKSKPANKGSKKDGQKAGTKCKLTSATTKVHTAEERIKSSRKKRKSKSTASANDKGSKRAKISSVQNSADDV